MKGEIKMLKAKDLQNSVWADNTGDFMEVSKIQGGWIAYANKFSLEAKTAKELQTKIKEAGFTHLGWD